jgi:hypothetical protein
MAFAGKEVSPMKMKRCIGIAFMLMTAIVLPGLALAADTGDQTSSPFLPGDDYTKALENVQDGELLQWYWSSTQNPDFIAVGPNGTTYTKPHYGIAYVGNESGDWDFIWTNENIAGSIIVEYRLRSFSVLPLIDTTRENTTIHSRTLELEGSCHPDLASLEYSTDNITYTPVFKSGSAWSADVGMSEGRNVLYLKYKYSFYDNNFTGYREVNYTVSTFWINWDNPGSLGVGSLLMLTLVILAVVLLVLLKLVKRRRQRRQLVQQAREPELVPVQQGQQPPPPQYPPPPPPGGQPPPTQS